MIHSYAVLDFNDGERVIWHRPRTRAERMAPPPQPVEAIVVGWTRYKVAIKLRDPCGEMVKRYVRPEQLTRH